MSAPPRTADAARSLLARARNHDGEAWLQLVKWIGPLLLRWCGRAGLQAAECEEVARAVLSDVWRSLASFRKDAGQSFRVWVYSLVRNRARDLLARRRAACPLPADPDPAEALELKRRALQLLLQAVLARNPDQRFRAFYRTAVDGLSALEADQELALGVDVVRQYKARWLKRLREELGERFDELLD
jgi:RNA polymerase sigma-70 factor (ECF subfamily)